jgi:hypothetical protein
MKRGIDAVLAKAEDIAGLLTDAVLGVDRDRQDVGDDGWGRPPDRAGARSGDQPAPIISRKVTMP